MACAEPRLTGLKIAYQNEIHRIRVDLSTFQYEHLVDLFERTYGFPSVDAFVIQYRDADNDILNITSQTEYIEAVKEYLATKPTACLRFEAMTHRRRAASVAEERLTAPILKVLEKLVEQLQNTILVLKNEDWKGRYNKGMEIADQALQTTKEKVKIAADNVKEKGREMEIEKFVTSAQDGLKSATETLGAFAKDFVEEMKKIKEDFNKKSVEETETPAASVTETTAAETETSVEEKVTTLNENEIPLAVPATEASNSNSDNEWESINQNANAKPEAQMDVVAIENVQPDPVNEKANLICEFFPACTKETALRLLAEANDNVEVVMNRLAEQGY